MVRPAFRAMFFNKRPTALAPEAGVEMAAERTAHARLRPPNKTGGAVRLFNDETPGHLQAVDSMALVSGKRTVPGMPRSSVANLFAAVENQLMTKVLLIEDDSETAEEITAELADRGFEVEWSANGIEGLDKARSSRPDAMIVDRLLPGMDGLTIIETLRKDQVRTPVLVLSALGAVDDRVRGLRMGGDDYLTKPFAIVELVARVEALLRRPAESRETTLRVGPLELDLIERTARRGDRAIDLLPREFRLLEYMMQRSDQLLTRAMLLEEVWNYKFVPATNLVDVHMGRLRHKVDGPDETPMIHNVRGAGFILRTAP
jgi:two-component system, OmpR family, response regulator